MVPETGQSLKKTPVIDDYAEKAPILFKLASGGVECYEYESARQCECVDVCILECGELVLDVGFVADRDDSLAELGLGGGAATHAVGEKRDGKRGTATDYCGRRH